MKAVVLVLLVGVAACGHEPMVVVTIDLGGLTVPATLDALLFRVVHQSQTYGEKTYPLAAGDREASLLFTKGADTPDTLTVVAIGTKAGAPVAQSFAKELAFVDGDVRHVDLLLKALP
ncbi:MAG: hypothetical protein HY903_25185 [Deltaproteobacteria bacterium]|nr:hypothetical protein [Deltaproteobacteria bacterium]